MSVFERANNAHFNTVVMIDADGSILGTYRKSHIPDGPGYTEKWVFCILFEVDQWEYDVMMHVH